MPRSDRRAFRSSSRSSTWVEKRILALVHAEPAALRQCGASTQLPSDYYYPAAKGILPWGKPSLGKWELRDVYVIEMSRLPAFSQGYCYSRRVLYIDKETFMPLAIELYDPQGALVQIYYPILDANGDSQRWRDAGNQRPAEPDGR